MRCGQPERRKHILKRHLNSEVIQQSYQGTDFWDIAGNHGQLHRGEASGETRERERARARAPERERDCVCVCVNRTHFADVALPLDEDWLYERIARKMLVISSAL